MQNISIFVEKKVSSQKNVKEYYKDLDLLKKLSVKNEESLKEEGFEYHF